MKRREFIKIIGGGAAAWPLAARAQQTEGMRRLAVLSPLSPGDLDNQSRHSAFLEALRQLGWIDGRNLRVEARHSAGDPADTRKYAAELVALAPDVILTTGGAGAAAMLQATRSVPIVFVIVPDPVGSGFVESLPQPGRNATGFMMFEYDLSAKWLELLKQIAPNVTHAAVLRDAAIAAGIGQFAVIQSVARSVGVDVRAINLRDAAEIEHSITAFARIPNGALVLTASALSALHRDLIISLAARFKLPMTYHERYYVAAGGLQDRQSARHHRIAFAARARRGGDRIAGPLTAAHMSVPGSPDPNTGAASWRDISREFRTIWGDWHLISRVPTCRDDTQGEARYDRWISSSCRGGSDRCGLPWCGTGFGCR